MTQILCNAGIYVLSPAPRGSWEFGQDYHNLIQGDLGGGEILDVLAAARTFSGQLGIPPHHIGAVGISQGGYSVLRLLTFPGKVIGVPNDFKWGFGISDSGFSNLLRVYNTANIKGWFLDLMGEDPNLNPERWLDRSPETHASKAHGPILLTHGTHDKRINVEESRAMYEALTKAGKPVTYYEMQIRGMGSKAYLLRSIIIENILNS